MACRVRVGRAPPSPPPMATCGPVCGAAPHSSAAAREGGGLRRAGVLCHNPCEGFPAADPGASIRRTLLAMRTRSMTKPVSFP